MKIALAQLNPIIGDFEYNKNKILQYIEKAKQKSCSLVIFSELIISGYPPKDLLEKNTFIEKSNHYFNEILNNTNGIAIILGNIEINSASPSKSLYNSAFLFENGKIIQTVRKRLLPNYDVFDETRYFEADTNCDIIEYKNYKIGITICEDLWNDRDFFIIQNYNLDPVEKLASKADIIINISASPFYESKNLLKHKMLKSLCLKYKIPFIYVNQVGANDSLIFDGASCAFDKNGNLVSMAKNFEEDIVLFDLTTNTGEKNDVLQTGVESILNALVCGTKDYIKKCGFKKVYIGLSGGIDSALVAVIAVMALGKENVSTIFMPSKFTSNENYEDTRQLADNLGVSIENIEIDPIFDSFLNSLNPLFKDKSFGLAEQNIQARIRGTLLMALSNKEGNLVLTTGNKSESAVGYCTLYGDMCGGLSVISDLPKITCYALASYINKDREIIPKRIITKAPSAELKPDQKDQDDLPPYEILDQILKEYIENNKSVDEIVNLGFEKNLVIDICNRIYKNEYKRQQAAPGLKVTTKAFGYGRRYPIAQKFFNYI